MKKIISYFFTMMFLTCVVVIGIITVNAQNVYSWSVTMNVGDKIGKQVEVINKYTRAGNYRTNSNSSVMNMDIIKTSGTSTGTVVTSTSPTYQRKWVWSSWGSRGSGTYSFEYKLASGNTFTGSLQATDSEAMFD